jgi:hypothetical protein
VDRRHFLQLLLPAAGAVVLAPELLELLAPKRTIFLPPRWDHYENIRIYSGSVQSSDIERQLADRMKQDIVRHIDQLAWSHFNDTITPLARFKLGAGAIVPHNSTWNVYSDWSPHALATPRR